MFGGFCLPRGSRARGIALGTDLRPTLREELLEQLAAGLSQHAAHDLRVVIELGMTEQVDDGAGHAGLGIVSREHHPLEARMHQRHGTHGARLQRHVELTIRQAVVLQQL